MIINWKQWHFWGSVPAFVPRVDGTPPVKTAPVWRRNRPYSTLIFLNKSFIICSDHQIVLVIIYQPTCFDCRMAYFGQAGRRFQTRYNEHLHSFRTLGSQWSLAQHLLDNSHTMGSLHNTMKNDIGHLHSTYGRVNECLQDWLENLKWREHLEDNSGLEKKLKFILEG
jgi:hypothetical protein